jgi:hypothetical protein
MKGFDHGWARLASRLTADRDAALWYLLRTYTEHFDGLDEVEDFGALSVFFSGG